MTKVLCERMDCKHWVDGESYVPCTLKSENRQEIPSTTLTYPEKTGIKKAAEAIYQTYKTAI